MAEINPRCGWMSWQVSSPGIYNESYIAFDHFGTELIMRIYLFTLCIFSFYSLVGTLPQLVIKIIFLKTKPKKKHAVKRGRGSTVDLKLVDMEEFQRVSAARKELYARMFKLPPYCKQIAWISLIVISVTACGIAIIYGLSV